MSQQYMSPREGLRQRHAVKLSGARKPGIPEDARWRALVEEAVAP